MIWSMKSLDGGNGGDEEDTGGGGGSIKVVKWQRRKSLNSATLAAVPSSKWIASTMLLFMLISGTAAVLSNSTFKGTVSFTLFLP